ncbi:MAG: ATP-binding protein, partial [Cyanobacteriota bacterium]
IVHAFNDDLIKGKYNHFNLVAQNLKLLELINNTYVFDSGGLIKYSTDEKVVGMNIKDVLRPEEVAKKPQNIIDSVKLFFQTMWDNITFSKLYINNVYNFNKLSNGDGVAFDSVLGNLSQVTAIYRGYIILAIIFIGCGFASAAILAKMVTKPIQDLYIGAEKFAKRDWSTRIKIESDDEIGKLAEAFNKMAEDLSQIYESLEQKVRERTKALEETNKEVEAKNSELGKAYDELKAAQVKLVHSEKMSSLGQLVAGVAHELNNPINFIYGNMEHLKNYAHDLKELLDKYAEFETGLSTEQVEIINDYKEEIDYEYLIEDLDDLLDSCKEGAERTRQIVLDLRNFSRLDEASLKEVNVHEGLDSTLNILHNKYKNRVDVVKDYDESVPPINCFAGQLNQVFMNLLANAAQAIDGNGTVTIMTRLDGDYVKIVISDTGCGISPDNLNKIFDPFFTTKDVGEGTGLGLSVSYGIIEKHNGTISVESKVGEGTKFTIRIPLKWRQAADMD